MNNIKNEINKIVIPSNLHERTLLGVKKATSEKGGKFQRFAKKRLASAILAISLIIPTSAFAYQALLVDEFYGSFENLKTHLSNAMMEGYLLLDAKLTQAKGDMDKQEFSDFKELLSVITSAKIEFGDKNGNIDYSEIPNEKLEELKEVFSEIQPYFDQLNGQKSSKEVLTASEYEEYIEATMTYEQIMAQVGIKEPVEIDKIPSDLQEDYLKASDVLSQVNEKQLKN